MGFQIQTSEKKAIAINDLDIEACALWGHEVDKKAYAKPLSRDKFENSMDYHFQSNWFDAIGGMIAHPSKSPYYSGWKEIKHGFIKLHMASHYFKGDTLECQSPEYIAEAYKHVVKYVEPYLSLIDHWESKGYIPVKID